MTRFLSEILGSRASAAPCRGHLPAQAGVDSMKMAKHVRHALSPWRGDPDASLSWAHQPCPACGSRFTFLQPSCDAYGDAMCLTCVSFFRMSRPGVVIALQDKERLDWCGWCCTWLPITPAQLALERPACAGCQAHAGRQADGTADCWCCPLVPVIY